MELAEGASSSAVWLVYYGLGLLVIYLYWNMTNINKDHFVHYIACTDLGARTVRGRCGC
jgi:hypothetical protein